MDLEEKLMSELKSLQAGLKADMGAVVDGKLAPHLKDAAENQKALDDLISWKKHNKGGYVGSEKKSFGEVFAESVESKMADIKSAINDRKGQVKLELKAVGVMTTAASLTGDAQASYGQRQGLIPSQKVNFRDLIPFTTSPTGQYIHYRETGGEGAFDVQTEGSAKANLDYNLTEIKTVSKYIAGTVTFAKQFATFLPWMQSTLTRLLLRDFYKKENSYFWTTVANGATGSVSSTETDDNKQLIDFIMQILDTDFNASFILVKNSQKGRLLKLLYDNGNYFGAGSIVGTPDGQISVAGVPIIGASWATDDKIMVVDTDYIERIETESMRVDLSFENNDNFEKNLITARLECFEELNLLRTDAHFYEDMGNTSA